MLYLERELTSRMWLEVGNNSKLYENIKAKWRINLKAWADVSEQSQIDFD